MALAVSLAVFGALCPAPALASSHSEAPGTNKDRLADDTDLYAWVANDAPQAVTFVGNWVPLIEPNSGPNFASFDDNASYYINVDNVGDSRKHVRFEFTFHTTRLNENTFLYNTGAVTSLDDPDLNVRQSWTLTRIEVDSGQETVLGTGRVAPYFVGPTSMPDYAALAQSAIQTLPGGYKVFVGPRDDPFFVDLAAVFDLLSIRRLPGDRGKGVDGVGGFNVMSIVMQVAKEKLTKDGMAPNSESNNHIIGIWDTAERQQTRVLNGDGTIGFSGPEIQVSRLGMPLVNEIVIPLGKKDLFNATEPSNDVANFGAYVVDPEPARLLQALFGINVPPAPRSDLVSVFATGVAGLNQPAGVSPGEMLRLNMSIPPASTPNRLGVLAGDVAGFPNGRRLGDDVVDIELRVVAGVLVEGFNISPNNRLGDGIDANDLPYLPYFPYVAPPQNPLSHDHHAKQHGPGRAVGDAMDHRDRRSAEAAVPETPSLRIVSSDPGSRATLQYALSRNARVSLRVYDVQGRMVRTLVDQDAASGTFRATWDGRTDAGTMAARGVFFARLAVDGRNSDTKKVVVQ
jgi:hypothetical protein